MDAKAAAACLGVRRQTLYAYVSRGRIRAMSDPADSRRSLYSGADVRAVAARNRRPRARADIAAGAIRWGDPVLETFLSEVRGGTLWYGSRPAVEMARTLTLEEVAAHHWRCDPLPFRGPPALEVQGGAVTRALTALAVLSDQADPLPDRSRAEIVHEGARLVGALLAAMAPGPPGGQAHHRLAAAWGVAAPGADLIRQALVLLSDHELNPSTFAVRVAASTGASLPACLMAGLSTLSGPRHGGVAARAAQALAAGETGATIQAFLARNPAGEAYGFGYGHPLYPAGDPRAAHLLEALGADSADVRPARAMADALGIPPNIDTALAALGRALSLPPNAAFTLFAVARATGWIAHAMEQLESGQIIRPRARFRPDKAEVRPDREREEDGAAGEN